MRINLTEVPDDWICEPCKSKTIKTSPARVNFVPQPSRGQRAVTTGKVKFLQEEEVIKLSSGNFAVKPFPANSPSLITQKASAGNKNFISKTPPPKIKSNPQILPNIFAKHQHPRNGGVNKNPLINRHASGLLSKGPTLEREHIRGNQLPLGGVIPEKKDQTLVPQKEKPTKRASFEALSTKSVPIVGSGPTKELEHIQENQQPLGGVIHDDKDQILDPQKEKPTKRASCEALSTRKSSPVIGSGGIDRAVAECNRSNVEKSKLCNIQEDFNHKLLPSSSLPSSIRAWSGQFQILHAAASGEFYDEFEAQPPCLVSEQAYEFSRKMPPVLQMEPLPASNVLTDIFQDDSPSLQDIALYFFPPEHAERSKKNLISILKIMNAEKSILRCFIDGVELLVFTSNQLDMDSRGTIAAVNAGCFLWGIFRRNKNDKAIERSPNTEPIDMDIDMIGGKDLVDRVDHVLKDKPKSFSQRSLDGTHIDSTSQKVEKKKTSSFSMHLKSRVRDHSVLSEEMRRKISFVFPSHLSESTKEHLKSLDNSAVPPGFEAQARIKVKEEEGMASDGRSVSKRACFVGHSGRGSVYQKKFKSLSDLKDC